MLVLTRKLMEKLFIGDDICITVVRLEGGQVRLGIDAPREVSVVRAELLPGRDTGLKDVPCRPHTPASSPAPHQHPAPNPASAGPAAPTPRPPVRIPQASAHETDSRRRGPSQ